MFHVDEMTTIDQIKNLPPGFIIRISHRSPVETIHCIPEDKILDIDVG